LLAQPESGSFFLGGLGVLGGEESVFSAGLSSQLDWLNAEC
jgi:hypothetical protein